MDNVPEGGEDYIGFNDTLTLIPGINSSNSTSVKILNDELFELDEETLEIRMKLADQSPFTRVHLVPAQRSITILDDDGKLHRVEWLRMLVFL